MQEVLITGGGGFLAAWIARRLAARGARLRLFDVPGAPRAANDIVEPHHASQLEWREGDIRNADDVRSAMEGCDGVIHLAGVLTPACSANPVRGAEINLIGSLHVFDAARALGLSKVVYASSAGVYGPAHARHPEPATHYGAFKLAVEGAARAYWNEHRIASVGFRPFVVYGPGRESGVSAGPSLACRAAVRSEPYTIGFTGACGLVYVDDAAQAFDSALFAPMESAHVFNLVGHVHTIAAVIAEIRRQVPDADLRAEGPPLTISADVAEDGLEVLLPAGARHTLADGIAATLDHYRSTQPD